MRHFCKVDILFVQHIKTKRLARKLQIPVPWAAGLILSIWLWSIQHRPSGVLDGIAPEEIAEICQWCDNPMTLVNALIESEFFEVTQDGIIVVHEWQQAGGKFVKDREDANERMRKYRERQKRDSHVTVTCESRDALELDQELDQELELELEKEYIAKNVTPSVAVAPLSPAKPSKVKKPPDTALAWEAYKAVLKRKHGIEPLRDAKANSLMSNLYKRVGAELPEVLEFYVMNQNSPLYLKGRHPLSLALLHIETIYGNWQAGREVTQTEANFIDKSITNYNTLQELRRKYAEK